MVVLTAMAALKNAVELKYLTIFDCMAIKL